MSKTDKTFSKRQLTRRSFLKGSVAGAAVLGTGVAIADPGDAISSALAKAFASSEATGEKEYFLNCRSNCFQCCVLNAHVVDGKLRKTSKAHYSDDRYSGCCLRGLSIVQRTYSPTRIKYPMRRVGERGAGEWERISWEDALKEIGEKFTAIQKEFGDQALVVDTGSGCYGQFNGQSGAIDRLANMLGATRANICYDQALGHGTNRVVGGGIWMMGNETADLMNAKTIFIWGSNPVYSQLQTWRIIADAQEKGTKLICIDPIKSATANKSDEYYPITPGTDLILALAMTRIAIEKDWLDMDYIKFKSNAPFLIRKDTGFMMRKSDFGVIASPAEEDYYVWDADTNSAGLASQVKNPVLEGSFVVNGVEATTSYSLLKARIFETTVEEASAKTGMTAETIEYLANEYANSGATSIYTNYGIDHYQNGHLWAMAIAVMGVLTGNIGRAGCSISGLFVHGQPLNYAGIAAEGSNGKSQVRIIPQTYFGEAFANQKLADGTPYPLKAMLTTCSNSMSNFADQNVWFNQILPNLDFWVTIDCEMYDSARYSDIVLPYAFWAEKEDLRVAYNNPFVIHSEKAIEPLFESKEDHEIYRLIAEAMGLGEYFPKRTTSEWLEKFLDTPAMAAQGITYETLKEKKAIRGTGSNEKPFVRGENGWPTTTGRAEIYCENPLPRTNYGQDISAVYEKERMPYWKPANEASSDNPLFQKYPLYYIQEHARYRTHTQWFETPILRELDPEPVAKISRKDAADRGIQTGDLVEVFNDRGHAVVKAVIDDNYQTGVISIPKGWQRSQFIEGCFQEMTNTSSDPMACNFAYFDALVDVRLYKGGAR